MTRKQLLAQLRRERKSDILLQGDKFEEKAFIEGKVKLITTNGTKGNQNNWQAVGCDWTCTKKDWFHWVDKACEKLGVRVQRSVCLNCESRGERWGKEAILRMLFQARSMEKRPWELGFLASRPSRFNPTFSLLWVLFLFLPLCFLFLNYHFIVSL